VIPLDVRLRNFVGAVAFRAALEPVTNLASYRDDDDQKTLESVEWNAVIQCAKHALSVFAP
jgi:hypothetical protein